MLECHWSVSGYHEAAASDLEEDQGKSAVSFFMEIIILMSWSIWTTRNDWLFNGKDPTVEDCLSKFRREFLPRLHRAQQNTLMAMDDWIHVLD
jgi:hypothetical protein